MNNKISENRILKLLVIIPILGILVASFIITDTFISTTTQHYKQDIYDTENSSVTIIKNRVKNRVLSTINIINTTNTSFTQNCREDIVKMTTLGHKIINNLYNDQKEKSKDNMFREIKHSLEKLRFFYKNTGYFFILDGKGKTVLEIKNNANHQKDKQLINEFIDIAKTKKEGFLTWSWNKENENILKEKVGYIKYFEPLDIIIGTAKYKEDIIYRKKQALINLVQNIEYQDYGYIFILDYDGTTLSHINKEYIGKQLSESNLLEQNIIKTLIEEGKKSNGGFIEHKQVEDQISDNLSSKITFMKAIPEFNLVLGSSLYTTKIRNETIDKKIELEGKLNEKIKSIIITSITITSLILLIMLFVINNLKTILNEYSKKIESKNQALKYINAKLENEIKYEVAKNKEQNDILHHQSKMASMGEMLGNIAHQWRQPLSAISTLASGIIVRNEFGQIDQKTINNELQDIVNNTQDLSKTIDDFRNFFDKDKKIELFNINDCINKVFKLISANLHNRDIIVVKDINPLIIKSLKNELTQALLNIINNAKDVLITLEENEKKIIIIKTYKKDEHLIIEIKDSGGGIKDDVINKIFEPYFTTKFKSQGTGIGLYMTQKIIVSNLKGSIFAKNVSFEYENKTFHGALFTIKLPINI